MARRISSSEIPERFLQQIWKHQNFATDLVRTTDNRQIEILRPGTINKDTGPDFIDAKIRIGDIVYRGDVELHQNLSEWTNHSHHKDPNYNSVILHVVFRGEPSDELPRTASNREVPTLILEHYLTSSFRDLWEKMILDERSERLATIKCFERSMGVDTSLLERWLNKLAVERIELKMRRYEERLKELISEQTLVLNEPPRYGEIPFGINPEDLPPPVQTYTTRDFGNSRLWEQLLYEGFMEALGYSKNQVPFLKLARNICLQWIADTVSSRPSGNAKIHIEAILFGAAGLLSTPKRIDDAETKEYVSQLQSVWKPLKKVYHFEYCDEHEWQFFRLRPDNFPTIRLAGAANLIAAMAEKRLLQSLIRIIKNGELTTKEKYRQIIELFTVGADGFWERHYRFGEQASTTLKKLIGGSRADEIVQNVVVPVCFLYARIFKDKEVRRATLEIFEQCLPVNENSILRTIGEQLIREKFKLNNAKLQQGALQLYKFYCVEERCGECAVGKAVSL